MRIKSIVLGRGYRLEIGRETVNVVHAVIQLLSRSIVLGIRVRRKRWRRQVAWQNVVQTRGVGTRWLLGLLLRLLHGKMIGDRGRADGRGD